MQPTLQAFLKRSAASISSTGITTTTVTAATTTAAAAGVLSTETGDKLTVQENVVETKTKRTRTATEKFTDDAGESSSSIVESTTKSESAVVSTAGVESSVVSTTTTTLTASGKSLTWVDQEIDRLEDERWKALLKKESTKCRTLFSFLESLPASKILPPKSNVFEAFRLCPFDNVRVVILGQDPYHGSGQAHGLAFSVRDGVQVPASLRNIYKEATNDLKAKSGKSGNLQCWASQGVLLLNALLTVESGKPMAHKGRGWEKFTDSCIAALSKERKNLVFMLWGKSAQEKGTIVDKSKHLVITSSHPSPLGAAQTAEPFLGSKCFSRCNVYLKEHGLGEINWDVK